MFHTAKKTIITQACLVDHEGKVYSLENPCIIGRSSDCGLQMEDPLISRKHIIMQEDSTEQWWVSDLRSMNGTYVNHQKIIRPTLVKHNDSIRIGGNHFIFHAPKTGTLDAHSGGIDNFSTSTCWIIMGDIMESSGLFQKLAYEQVISKIGDWSNDCSTIIHKYGGVVNRYLGDGFLAFWKRSEISQIELRALWAELNQIRENYQFSYRLLLHSGRLTMDGVPHRGQENLSGRALDKIFEMDSLASKYQCKQLISEQAAKVFEEEQIEAVSFPDEHEQEDEIFYRISSM